MAKELWFVGPHRVELREQSDPPVPPGHLRAIGLFSAVSHGTEGILFSGTGPAAFDPSLDEPGQATYPRRYGYAWVGRVVTRGDYCGALVFALAAHAEAHVLPLERMRLLPPALPPARATLAAAMETALTAVWDAGLRFGETLLVIGAGTIGVLIARIARASGVNVTVVEARSERHDAVRRLAGVSAFSSAGELTAEYDVVIEATGDPDQVNVAIARCRFEGRVVVASFYGNKAGTIALGDRFHRRRLSLVSSQVSTIPLPLRGRFDFDRRFEVVCSLLADDELDALTESVVPFSTAPDVYAQIGRGAAPSQVIFMY